LLVDTLGYDQLMLSKSAAEQLAEKTELAKHLEEREKKHNEQMEQMKEQARWMQEQMEEQRRELQEQMEEQARELQKHTEQNRKLQEQLKKREQQCQLVKSLQIEPNTTKSEADVDGP